MKEELKPLIDQEKKDQLNSKSYEKNNRKQETTIEPNQTRLDEFENANKHREIVHRGSLDTVTILTNTRMIATNSNDFRCKHEEKIDQMTEFCKNHQIDVVMLSETNGK